MPSAKEDALSRCRLHAASPGSTQSVHLYRSAALALVIVTLVTSACGSGGASLSGRYFARVQISGVGGGAGVFMMQLTENGSSFRGSLTDAGYTGAGGQVQTFSAALSGQISGSLLTVDVNSGNVLNGSSALTGSIEGSDILLSIPEGNGTLYPVRFVPGTVVEYNQAVAALQARASG